MVLLDTILAYDGNTLRAALEIRQGTRFFRPGFGVPVHVGIEWMAQACAAFAGLRAKQAGQPIKLGLLLGTRRYAATAAWFTEGERLTIMVAHMFEEDGMGVFDCRIEAAGAERATARLTVYQPNDPTMVPRS